jgi:hypothetical protein
VFDHSTQAFIQFAHIYFKTMLRHTAQRTVGIAGRRTFVTKTTIRAAGPEKQLPGMPQAALKKWWGYHAKTNNEITRSLSPFQQNHLGPLFKQIQHNAPHKITDNFLDVLPGAILLFGIMNWGESAFNEDQRSHWS